jgi:YbgC/YbaW family acyl-CoA thioester hydrolase
MTLLRTKFETQLQVRPDDIDMNQHVHGSRYFDYVLAARYDQMARCYKMPMEEFTKQGLGWVVKAAHVEYKRALRMGDSFLVRRGSTILGRLTSPYTLRFCAAAMASSAAMAISNTPWSARKAGAPR